MGCLACGEVSTLAWYMLERSVDAFMTIADEAVETAMRRLENGDPAVSVGPSGAAGLAGLMCIAGDVRNRTTIGLDRSSHVLVVATERPTAGR